MQFPITTSHSPKGTRTPKDCSVRIFTDSAIYAGHQMDIVDIAIVRSLDIYGDRTTTKNLFVCHRSSFYYNLLAPRPVNFSFLSKCFSPFFTVTRIHNARLNPIGYLIDRCVIKTRRSDHRFLHTLDSHWAE